MIDWVRDDRHWRRWFLLFWAAGAAYLLWYRWGAIHWFALPDTDDNMRFAQVRALLDGQGWYDLRQYRMNPPEGVSIHWSRLVDLPIAGLILLLRPIVGGMEAARWACAIAPLLAFGTALYATMLAARRLVDRWAFLLAPAILLCAPTTMFMFMPLRIDHHGWQLATLMVTIAGMADSRAVRGGITAGLATAVSLTIGLELLPYLAVAGGLQALWWVADARQGVRLRGYGLALAAGAAIGYVVFGSFDNARPLCDALTPVYLSTLLLAGGVSVALGSLPLANRGARLALTVAAGVVICGFFAAAWPQCLGRPEHISPELDKLWFSHIREAKPLYKHGWRIAFPTLSLSIIGVIGAGWACWRARGTPRAMPWLLVALLSLFSACLLFWQTRAGPGSQLVGVIGATALGWPLMRAALDNRFMLVRVFGSVAAFVLVSGSFAGLVVKNVPERKSGYRKRVDQANRRCPTLPALKPIAALPATTIMTFNDLGPRLMAVTHHSVISGPYHRAGAAILDTQHAFRATDPEVAHGVMRRHGATLLLLCPGTSESTVYSSEAPGGFYVQLARGQVPAWLAPVALPKGSPFRLWRRRD
ncbi:AcrB/AcrD/AcrF family protein [uncultured Sphingomonas sp.]|uniref:AcrB/AcrD/AcrF family protein n=1 Tax=uncultured Sphingomonas sp. TaxID=158754 RepID=UPI0025D28C79|nr:AcrB/AcrD/AcrF family protein [uncultured Sphingomonas sp.]